MSYEQPPGFEPEPPRHEPRQPPGPACTACGSADLEPGFVQDLGQGSQGATKWVRGALERGIFGGARRMGRDQLEIEAFRCQVCGHLEHYVR